MKVQRYIHFFMTSCVSLISLDFTSCMANQYRKSETCYRCYYIKKLDHLEKRKRFPSKRDVLGEREEDKNTNVKEHSNDDINLIDELDYKELFKNYYVSEFGIYAKILDIINEIKYIKIKTGPYNNINIFLRPPSFIYLGNNSFLVYQYYFGYHGKFFRLINSKMSCSHQQPMILIITSKNNISNDEESRCIQNNCIDIEAIMTLILEETDRNFKTKLNKITFDESSRKIEADEQNPKEVYETNNKNKSSNPKIPEIVTEIKKVGTPGNFFSKESLLSFLPKHNKDNDKNESKMEMTRDQLLEKHRDKSKAGREKKVKNKTNASSEHLNNLEKNLKIIKNNIKKKSLNKSIVLYDDDVLTEERKMKTFLRPRYITNQKKDSPKDKQTRNNSLKENHSRGKENNSSIPSRLVKRLDDYSNTKIIAKRKQLIFIVGLIGVCGLLILISYIILLKF